MGEVATVIAVGGILALLGLTLAWSGWKGRRVGDHPFCRRCGFDLFGRPEGSGTCPECGAALGKRRAVVIGERQRRPFRAGFGVLLVMTCLAGLCVVGWDRYKNIEWRQHEPLAWLIREARGDDIVIQTFALRELHRRYQAGTLSQRQVSAVVEAGLKVQGKSDRKWHVLWGDLIEQAHAAGLVTELQWQRYAGQAVATGWLKLETRQKIRQGGAVKSMLSYAGARVGSNSSLFAIIRESGLVVGEKEVLSGKIGSGGGAAVIASADSGSIGAGSDELEQTIRQLPFGKHEGYLRLRVRVTQHVPVVLPPTPAAVALASMQDASRPPRLPSPTELAEQTRILEERVRAERERAELQAKIAATIDKPTYADVEVCVPVHFEVVDRHAAIAVPVTDAKLAPAIEQALRVSGVGVTGAMVNFEVECARPPANLCCEVLLRDGAKEWPVGELTVRRDQSSPEWISGRLPIGEQPSGSVVDVVLRPSDGIAKQTDEIDTYWGEEVILKGVAFADAYQMPRSKRPSPFNRAVRSGPGGVALAVPGSTGSSNWQSRRPPGSAVISVRNEYDPPVAPSVGLAPPSSLPPATSAPARFGEQITRIRALQAELRDKLLAVPSDDLAHHLAFLQLADTGLVKLLPLGTYAESALGIRGGGAYYSFAAQTHEQSGSSDILLRDGRFNVGFGRAGYGYFLPLGDVSLGRLATATADVPDWAAPQVKNGWHEVWFPTPLSLSHFQQAEVAAVPGGGRPKEGVRAEPGRSFLLRSIRPGAADRLIGLRVVRQFDDGSVLIAYRVLKTFENPEGPR